MWSQIMIVKSSIPRYVDALKTKRELEAETPFKYRIKPAQVGWRIVLDLF